MIRRERLLADSVSLITLSRPERRNALDPEHWRDLTAGVRGAVDSGARAIVITGDGSAFCAGGDLGESDVEGMAVLLEQAFAAIREVPVPVIAHVNGAAVGAGVQLAVSCDLRVVGARARFRVPAAALGLPVSPGTIRRIVALGGAGAARAMLIGGDWIGAERAYGLGLADRVGDLDGTVRWASEIAGYAPRVVAYFKRHLQVEDQPGDLQEFRDVIRQILKSDDYAESVNARIEGRQPRYRGC
jgi:enoyl-CoA hydratase/carnithine racemase